MKYVASVRVQGIEEAGVVINMFDIYGNDTTDPEKAESGVIQCSIGYITVNLNDAPIYALQ